MSEIRNKAIAAGLGSSPPNWSGTGLGRAESDPAGVVKSLNMSGFVGTGNDWIADVTSILSRAFKSSVLNGLYREPIPRRGSGDIVIGASSDLYSFGNGAVMLRMIKSTLWAAETMGLVALPARLKIDATSDRRGVWIHIS